MTITIHAPSANFAIAKTTATTTVAVAPSPLMIALRRQPGARSRSQWRTIPACDSVNAVNTPMAYSGMSASTRPPNATATRMARAASATIPALNASRSPRYANRRGMNPSRARIEASRGKSAKLVLRREHEDPHRREDQHVVQRPVPNTARPICDRTDSWSARHRAADAREVRHPQEHDAEDDGHRPPCVVWAFFHSGGLNAGIPFEIASVAGHRAAAVGERPHQQQQAERLDRDGDRSTPVTWGGCRAPSGRSRRRRAGAR